MSRRLYPCEDCIEAWGSVCDEGVPSVCALIDYGSPVSEVGEAAISKMCETFGTVCDNSGGSESCAGQCEESDNDTYIGRSAPRLLYTNELQGVRNMT